MSKKEYNENECSRCEELMAPDQVASKHGEVPFCIDCEGYCRGCGGQEDEELLEHGLCDSCCKDMDEEAEAEERKCACGNCDCKNVDEYVNGDTDDNGVCADCFRDHTPIDNEEETNA